MENTDLDIMLMDLASLLALRQVCKYNPAFHQYLERVEEEIRIHKRIISELLMWQSGGRVCDIELDDLPF